MQINSVFTAIDTHGSGKRMVVVMQGCSRRCPGCNAPEAQLDPGRTVETSVHILAWQMQFNTFDGLTVTGGEPFEQPGELSRLLKAAKSAGLSTLLYTGYTWDELHTAFNGIARDLLRNVLAYVDILIDGPWMETSAQNNPLVPSTNQRVLHLLNGTLREPLVQTTHYTITA